MPEDRLQKVLAAAGVASRRASEVLISAGRVTVDGHVATIGERVDPATATILVDGKPIAAPETERLHIAIHKPAGVVSTVRDRHAERTVIDLVPRDLVPPGARLYPVGRLDRDSEGLILLTNDGPWADRVLHPRSRVEREYALGLATALTPDDVARLERGIPLDEGLATLGHLRRQSTMETRAIEQLLRPTPPALDWYRATIEQGWKRQLRRMFAAVGAPVERLVRIRIGTLRLGELAAGEVRVLSPREARDIAASGSPNPADR